MKPVPLHNQFLYLVLLNLDSVKHMTFLSQEILLMHSILLYWVWRMLLMATVRVRVSIHSPDGIQRKESQTVILH